MVKATTTWLFVLLGLFTQAQDFATMSFNIRLNVESDGVNRWDNRKSEVVRLIQYYHPVLIGMQEVLEQQRLDLLDGLPAYQSVGVARTDGKRAGEYSCILIDTTRFSIREQQTFWLSTQPNKPSKGWDAAYERVCTYARVRDKQSKKELWVMNTHFDHVGLVARLRSAQLILDTMRALQQRHAIPAILMGDFNARPTDDPIQLLAGTLLNTRDIARVPAFGPADTWNAFDFTQTPQGCIDYIWLTKNSSLEVDRFITITHSWEKRYPSDHFPVMAHFRWMDKKKKI